MSYTFENQKKALDYLVKKYPHDILKFRSLYNVEVQGKEKAKIPLLDILLSDIWSASEKSELMTIYGYDDIVQNEKNCWTFRNEKHDDGSNYGMEGFTLVDGCVKNRSYSGLEALFNLGGHISLGTIKRIMLYIDDPKERYRFCKLIVDHYSAKDEIYAYQGAGQGCQLMKLSSLCDRYAIYTVNCVNQKNLLFTASAMKALCETNDLDLLKLFLPLVKDINSLFSFAVTSGNIEIIKLFIECGAKINFQDLEFIYDYNRIVFKTPLKVAIDNNDLTVVSFLHENGADLNFVDKSEKMQSYIDHLRHDETTQKTHYYADYWDRHDYMCWAMAPLEYAINLGPASIIDQDLINNTSRRRYDTYEKQFKDRIMIVRYLYDSGATFTGGSINYTDLICFAINSDDFATTKYFFEEAYKNKAQLDFSKIISFIHIPGRIKRKDNAIESYKSFEQGAIPWLRLCEEYCKKMDTQNYELYIKLMLLKIFNELCDNDYQYNIYKSLIKDFSKLIPKEELKDIPAGFGLSLENIEDVISFGFDINCPKDGQSIIMSFLLDRSVNPRIINKLVSLGANINFQDPQSGRNALSCAIDLLHKFDFCTYVDIFDKETGTLYYSPEEYDKEAKAVIKTIIDLSSEDIITSDSVKKSVYFKIKPGYPQIVFNDVLQALSSKGFIVDDDYVAKSVTFLGDTYSYDYVTNPWGYLWNLYHNFSNKGLQINYSFPNIEDVKNIKYGTKQGNDIFSLISEHLKRCFLTSKDDVSDPEKVLEDRCFYDPIRNESKPITNLEAIQDSLLREIERYVGLLNYHFIIALIDSFSLIDKEAILRSNLLALAINNKDKKLAKELVKRGASIVCIDANGHDVTQNYFTQEQIDFFLKVSSGYNPNEEFDDLLAAIGVGEDPGFPR